MLKIAICVSCEFLYKKITVKIIPFEIEKVFWLYSKVHYSRKWNNLKIKTSKTFLLKRAYGEHIFILSYKIKVCTVLYNICLQNWVVLQLNKDNMFLPI